MKWTELHLEKQSIILGKRLIPFVAVIYTKYTSETKSRDKHPHWLCPEHSQPVAWKTLYDNKSGRIQQPAEMKEREINAYTLQVLHIIIKLQFSCITPPALCIGRQHKMDGFQDLIKK